MQRHKDIEKLKKKRADEKQIKTLQDELDKDIDKYLEKDKTISKKELKHSLEERSILSLSNSIKWMYNMCIIASTGGFAWALCNIIF